MTRKKVKYFFFQQNYTKNENKYKPVEKQKLNKCLQETENDIKWNHENIEENGKNANIEKSPQRHRQPEQIVYSNEQQWGREKHFCEGQIPSTGVVQEPLG